jgi:hypothetical protein
VRLTEEEHEGMLEAAASSTASLLFGIGVPVHSPIEEPDYTQEQVIAFLLTRFPIDAPVMIRVAPTPDNDMGVLEWDGRQFDLWVDPRLSNWEFRDTLFHEWAHVRAEIERPTTREHGPRWGIKYAEIWSAWMEE